MSRSKISETTITFTVLHRTDDFPLQGQHWGEMNDPYDGELGYLMQEAWDGGMVGIESDSVTVPVADEDVESKLLAMGNDGTFFDDEDEDEDSKFKCCYAARDSNGATHLASCPTIAEMRESRA